MKNIKFLVLVFTFGFLGFGCQSSLEVDKSSVAFLPEEVHDSGIISDAHQIALLERANQIMQSFKNGSYHFTFQNMGGVVTGQGMLPEFSKSEFGQDMNMAYHDGILSVKPLQGEAGEDSILFKDFRISNINDHSIRFDSDFEKSHNDEATKTDEKWSGYSYWIFDFSNPPLVSVSYHLDYNYEKIVKIDAAEGVSEYKETETYRHSYNTTFEEIMCRLTEGAGVEEDSSDEPRLHNEPVEVPQRLEGYDVTGALHLNIVFNSPMASIEITKDGESILGVSQELSISEYSDINATFETEAATIIVDLVVIESTGKLAGHIFVNSKTSDERTKYTFDGRPTYF
ncbi:MAG: hypothetical protein HYW47_06400 [Deltaproteobacteria bacterium]|nr:hypothetical protein [Deltaproteobacteria bacterium]